MSLKTCTLCHSPGARRVRVIIFPWDQRCIFVCAACKGSLPEVIQDIRSAIEARMGLTEA